MTATPAELWVCWTKPPAVRNRNIALLTFLPAWEQFETAREHGPVVIDGRRLTTSERRDVRAAYLQLVADIGIAKLSDGRTLRQVLSPRDGSSSLWWYHPVAGRDTELDPTFLHMLQIGAIVRLARELNVRRLVLHSAPPDIAAALESGFDVERQQPVAEKRWLRRLGAVGSRCKSGIRTAMQARAARAAAQTVPVAGSTDVAFAGYWSWSIKTDAAGRIVDRQFVALPSELQERGVADQCWFAWLDEQGRFAARWDRLAREASNARRVVLLQAFLDQTEIGKAALNLRPLRAFRQLEKSQEFRNLFVQEGIDLYPLFRERLILGFLGGSLPMYELMSLATERAARAVRPKVVFEFLDHFPAARARYDGVRRGAPTAVRCAVQHASYAPETMILALDPEREYRGEPDRCASPHADYACAMGGLGRDLFVEYGYPPERVIVTGSPRHETAGQLTDGRSTPARPGHLRILIVAAMALDIEIDMLEASYLAVDGLAGVSLSVRNHPLKAVTSHPRFSRISHRFAITTGSLAADLAASDLVLFTYSTVGEEAFLEGRRLVQWVPLAFDGSALAEVAPIRRCGTVSELRRTIEEQLAGAPDPCGPLEKVADVRHRLFGPAVGSAAGRIAEFAVNLLRPAAIEPSLSPLT
jgi:surface carbohydrate biosynthesis protein (TIGR04326 family)